VLHHFIALIYLKLRATKAVTAPNSKTRLSVGVVLMWMVYVAILGDRRVLFAEGVGIFNYGPFK
jgi:hypothetical protein